jgi:ATP synthase protein I
MQRNKLEELDEKLAEYQKKYDNPKLEQEKTPSSALFIAAEIVAGISIGTIVGYYFDRFLHTKILFLLIFIILGLISSLYNIYKKYK